LTGVALTSVSVTVGIGVLIGTSVKVGDTVRVENGPAIFSWGNLDEQAIRKKHRFINRINFGKALFFMRVFLLLEGTKEKNLFFGKKSITPSQILHRFAPLGRQGFTIFE
jgi:hypothetical protein